MKNNHIILLLLFSFSFSMVFAQPVSISGRTGVFRKNFLLNNGCLTTDGSVKSLLDSTYNCSTGNIQITQFTASMYLPSIDAEYVVNGCCFTEQILFRIRSMKPGQKFYIENIKAIDLSTGKPVKLPSIAVKIYQPAVYPYADFSVSRRVYKVGKTVTFSNHSRDAVGQAEWDYGDGTVDNLGSHRYKEPGVYTVSIKVTSKDGKSDWEEKKDYIKIVPNIMRGKCSGDSIVVDYNGNSYKTVQIGEQCWLAENLRNTHYSDGTPITGYEAYKGKKKYFEEFGFLYTFPSTIKNNTIDSIVQGICPVGWHVPTLYEISYLNEYLGGEKIAGFQMKCTGWHPGEISTGISKEYDHRYRSGFSGIPGGKSFLSEKDKTQFEKIGEAAFFWTSSSDSTGLQGTFFQLNYENRFLQIDTALQSDGYSVRCIKD